MSKRIGGGWAGTIELEPGEEVVKEGELWHRQTADGSGWFAWPPPSYGKLALTTARLIYLPPKWFLLALDRRVDDRLAGIASVAIVSAPRSEEPVMAFHRTFAAWDTLRVEIGTKTHWFATEGFTIAEQAELEDWLRVIAAATGLEARREEVGS
jgi:hypothetical protein